MKITNTARIVIFLTVAIISITVGYRVYEWPIMTEIHERGHMEQARIEFPNGRPPVRTSHNSVTIFDISESIYFSGHFDEFLPLYWGILILPILEFIILIKKKIYIPVSFGFVSAFLGYLWEYFPSVRGVKGSDIESLARMMGTSFAEMEEAFLFTLSWRFWGLAIVSYAPLAVWLWFRLSWFVIDWQDGIRPFSKPGGGSAPGNGS